MKNFTAESAYLEPLSQTAELYDLVHDVHGILDDAGISHAVMSGLHAAVLQEAATGAPHRVTGDGDLWVPDAHIERAAEVLDAQSSHRGIEVSYFSGSDRTIVTVQRDAEVELMACMDVSTPDGIFAFRMTPRVEAARRQSIGNWRVPFAASEDSIILKSLLQRSNGKHDARDIAAIQDVTPINARYLRRRMSEINSDSLEHGFYGNPVQQRIMPYLGHIARI